MFAFALAQTEFGQVQSWAGMAGIIGALVILGGIFIAIGKSKQQITDLDAKIDNYASETDSVMKKQHATELTLVQHDSELKAQGLLLAAMQKDRDSYNLEWRVWRDNINSKLTEIITMARRNEIDGNK